MQIFCGLRSLRQMRYKTASYSKCIIVKNNSRRSVAIATNSIKKSESNWFVYRSACSTLRNHSWFADERFKFANMWTRRNYQDFCEEYFSVTPQLGFNRFNSTYPYSCVSRYYSKHSVADSLPLNLDQVIFNLQSDIRRIKRVYRSDLEYATSLLSGSGENCQVHGRFLLSCCGSYLPEVSLEIRMEILQSIWKRISLPDVECYDALLKSYTDNNFTSFDPFLVLDEMNNFGHLPSEESYYYVLLSFCQRGEIKNAAKILRLIKNNTMSVDERFFNALVLGNARAGDIKSARNVLIIMKSSHLEPTLDSYVTLMQAYIENNDLIELENTYLGAIQKVGFSNETLLKLLKVAARVSYEQGYLQVLQWLTDSDEFDWNIVNTILEFVYAGLNKEAGLLLQKSQKALKSYGPSFGSFYVRALIKSDAETSVVIKMCDFMHKHALSKYSFYIASEACLRQKKMSTAVILYEEMKQREIELRPHFFFPIIINTFENSGLTGLMKTLEKMAELSVAPDFDILYEWVLPRAFSEVDNPHEVAKLIKHFSGLSYTSGVLSSILVYLLRQFRVADAVKFAQNVKSPLKHTLLVTEALLVALTKGEEETIIANTKLAVPLLKFVANSSLREDKTDYIGYLMVNLTESLGNSLPAMVDSFMKELSVERVCISETAFNIIESNIGKECTMGINSDLVYQTNAALSNKGLQHPRDMDLAALKCHVHELSSKQLNTRGATRKLFLQYCQRNDKVNALKLKETFEQSHEGLSIGMKAALLGLYTRNGMVVDARTLYNEIKNNEELAMEGGLDIYKILDLATLLINSDHIDEGLDLLKQDFQLGDRPGLSKTIVRNIVRLLEAIVSNLDNPDTTKSILDLLLQNSIAEPCSPIIGILIKQLIDNNNITAAVSEFVYYAMKYKITPSLVPLYYSVLDNEDLLAKIFSCCMTIRGNVEAKHTLAFVKAGVGDLDGSAKIFLKLGKQVRFDKIIKQCRFLTDRKEFLKLQNLAKSLQMTGKNYDCSDIYVMGLEATKIHGDAKNHKSIIEAMQQQDLVIPVHHLSHAKGYQYQ